MKSEAETIIKFIGFSNQLKKQLRTIKLAEDRKESVADHSWQLALLVLLIHPHLKIQPDLLKCLKMALIHDIVEAEVGDIPHGYTVKNRSLKLSKQQQELQEIEKVKNLVGGELGQEFFDLWNEYENQSSNEAKLVKAADSLEANLQSALFDVSYWDNYFYKIALTKAGKHCAHEPILTELNDAINKRLETKYKEAGLDVEKIKAGLYDSSPIGKS